MQHLYYYTQKPAGNKSAYKTLFSFSAKLLLVILIAFIVMLINISKASAKGQLNPSFKRAVNESAFLKAASNKVLVIEYRLGLK
ncbi:MAG: hypothetical protein ABI402_12410 [Ferruginibacter sp.]